MESSRAKRSVKLSGTIQTLTTGFQVELHKYKRANLRYRGRVGSINVPEELAGIVIGVHGFDNQPVARPRYRLLDKPADPSAPWDGKPHVDFPSSSPYSFACGGTTLTGSGTTITSEVVWNDGPQGGAGGGGVSNLSVRRSYQTSLTIPASPDGKNGRGVPDVTGDADPKTGYQIFLAGSQQVVGGTSAGKLLTALGG